MLSPILSRQALTSLKERQGEVVSHVDRLLEGAIDIHVHFAPDPRVERRGDAIEVARQARDMGMRGMVLKVMSTLPIR
jgi:hypothetical protein